MRTHHHPSRYTPDLASRGATPAGSQDRQNAFARETAGDDGPNETLL
jgi:hypothetical protein